MTEKLICEVPEPGRRKADVPELDRALIELIRQVQGSMSRLEAALEQHILTQRLEIADVLTTAFPQGDADGHRRYHEAMIKAAEDRAKFWFDLRMSVAKWGLLGVLGWLVVLTWNGFLQGPHK
jgi:hypothetical protein